MQIYKKGGNLMHEKQTIFAPYPDVVSIYQLKEMLGIGISLAYKLVKQNSIRSRRVGREYKIPKANVIEYITTSSN